MHIFRDILKMKTEIKISKVPFSPCLPPKSEYF